MAYDPYMALQAIDQHRNIVLLCLAGALLFSFIYFLIGIRMAIRQQVYVEPFLAVSVFFWHDLSFVLLADSWRTTYGNHWWLQLWTYGLAGTVLLEAFLLYQFTRYGRKELFPELSREQFAGLTLAGFAAVGVLWLLIKGSLNDPLYFITFAITAFWSTPFHTGVMLRRRSSAGQSIAMNLCVVVIFACVSVAFMTVVPAFQSPIYYATFAVFLAWPFFNIWLIRRMPSEPAYAIPAPIDFRARTPDRVARPASV